MVGQDRPTPRSADAAAPRANVGGISGENHAPARAWDGDAAPLTLSLGDGDEREDTRAFSHAAALKRAWGVEEKQ